MCASFPSSGPEGGRPHFLLAGRAVPYYNGTKNTRVVSSSDRPLEGGLLLKEWKAKLHDLTAIVPRGVMNFLITAFFMAGAYYLSRLLFQFGVENNSALVYVLAVTFVSWPLCSALSASTTILCTPTPPSLSAMPDTRWPC